MTTNTNAMTTPEDESNDDEWNPEPAKLREGETTDESSHAARNIQQLRQAAEDGDLDEDTAEDAIQDIRDGENGGEG